MLKLARLLAPQAKLTHRNPPLIVHTTNTELLSDQSKPVSLVLGFGGAKRKHVEKYAAVYGELGIPSVSYTGTNWVDNVPEVSEGDVFAPLFEHPTYRDRNLIIHTISMNGFRSLAKLYRWMDHQKFGVDKISGIIFDSCPSVTNLNSTVHGMSATHPSSVFGEYIHLPHSVYHTVLSTAMTKLKPEMLSSRLLFHYMLEESRLPDQQHYIYSKTDQVIDFNYIEAFIAGQMAKGCNVTSKRYEDVAHVRHLNADATGYKHQVIMLIKRSQ